MFFKKDILKNDQNGTERQTIVTKVEIYTIHHKSRFDTPHPQLNSGWEKNLTLLHMHHTITTPVIFIMYGLSNRTPNDNNWFW